MAIRLIQAMPKGQCDLCGKMDELRPYGPNGEFICFECGMKDEATTSRMFVLSFFPEKLKNFFIAAFRGKN